MEIGQFLRDNQPKSRRSILYNHLDEILLLRSKGYSLVQIQDYLKSNGVVISVSLICRFIKNQKTNILDSPVSSELLPANKSVILNTPPSEQSTNPFSVLNKETKSSQFKFTPHKK